MRGRHQGRDAEYVQGKEEEEGGRERESETHHSRRRHVAQDARPHAADEAHVDLDPPRVPPGPDEQVPLVPARRGRRRVAGPPCEPQLAARPLEEVDRPRAVLERKAVQRQDEGRLDAGEGCRAGERGRVEGGRGEGRVEEGGEGVRERGGRLGEVGVEDGHRVREEGRPDVRRLDVARREVDERGKGRRCWCWCAREGVVRADDGGREAKVARRCARRRRRRRVRLGVWRRERRVRRRRRPPTRRRARARAGREGLVAGAAWRRRVVVVHGGGEGRVVVVLGEAARAALAARGLEGAECAGAGAAVAGRVGLGPVGELCRVVDGVEVVLAEAGALHRAAEGGAGQALVAGDEGEGEEAGGRTFALAARQVVQDFEGRLRSACTGMGRVMAAQLVVVVGVRRRRKEASLFPPSGSDPPRERPSTDLPAVQLQHRRPSAEHAPPRRISCPPRPGLSLISSLSSAAPSSCPPTPPLPRLSRRTTADHTRP